MTARGFGSDVVFPLPNPKWKMARIAAGLMAFSTAPFLIDSKGDPRLTLLRVVAGLVGLFGLWAVWRTVALFRTKELSVVVTSRYLELRVVRGGPASRAPLEDVDRVVRQSMNGRRTAIVFEISDGRKLAIAALMLPPDVEAEICELVTERAALRKAGVDTREELAAAEAYLDAARDGARPFGVQVIKAKEPASARSSSSERVPTSFPRRKMRSSTSPRRCSRSSSSPAPRRRA
jgi:hypothetical protein